MSVCGSEFLFFRKTRVGKRGSHGRALVNHAGTFAYVVSGVDNTVTAYSIDGTTGKLTAVTNGSAATGNIPRGMAVVAVP